MHALNLRKPKQAVIMSTFSLKFLILLNSVCTKAIESSWNQLISDTTSQVTAYGMSVQWILWHFRLAEAYKIAFELFNKDH